MKNLRILIVLTPAFKPNAGGVQMSTSKMARWFSGVGHEVAIFSFAESGHDQPSFANLVHATQSGGSRAPANRETLRDCVRDFQPDVVVNQMPYEHEIGDLLKSEKGFLLLGCLRNTLFSVKGDLKGFIQRAFPAELQPLLQTRLGRLLVLAQHRRRHARELRQILQTYDHFVMFGPPNLEELEYFLPGYDRSRVRLVPNSIPAVAESVPRKEKRILWLGRVANAQKQARLIPEVWRRICQEMPDWELDIVGDGPELSWLKTEISKRATPRVNFHGRQVPDEFYQRAAIFFMTSAFEGFPNTLVEAQSHGAVPVVFDSYPVASWIVESGVNGELIAPFDVEQMGLRILNLAANDDLRVTMAEASLESARRFRIDRVGKEWQALFASAIAERSD